MQNMDNAYGGDKRRNPTKQSIEEYTAKQSIHCLRLIIAKLAQLKYRGIGSQWGYKENRKQTEEAPSQKQIIKERAKVKKGIFFTSPAFLWKLIKLHVLSA